jgi:cytochrome oxidase assembly protein ShyY1
MYRFALKPAWIVSHFFVLVLIVAMLGMGRWQLQRLSDKQHENAQIEHNTAAAPVSRAEFNQRLAASTVEKQRFVRVSLTGTYRPEQEVAIRNRSMGGAPGRWVVTPFQPDDGGRPVLVMRGFLNQSLSGTTAPIAGAQPPTGAVTLVGYVQPTQMRGSIGPRDPAEGTLGEMARVDVTRIAQQVGDVEPYWLQLAEQTPPSDPPVLVPLPTLDEGPHFSYAVQWGIFTLIAIIGYPLVLRRESRRRDRDPKPVADA